MRLNGLLGLRGLFGAALLLGAALVFWVQLLVSRLVLPVMGGSSAVWNTSLVFFQTALLLGYLYAHVTAHWWGNKLQTVLHPLLLVGAVAFLPFSLGHLTVPTDSGNPVPWLLGILLTSIGVPFTVLAGTAPILQNWFARTGTETSGDPYYLYAASNLGSLAALISYPTLVEPYLPLAAQNNWWAAGYVVLAVFTAVCALATRRVPTPRLACDATPAVSGAPHRQAAACSGSC